MIHRLPIRLNFLNARQTHAHPPLEGANPVAAPSRNTDPLTRRAAVFKATQISIDPRLLQNWLLRPKFTKFQWVEWLITAQSAIWSVPDHAACQIRAAKGKTGFSRIVSSGPSGFTGPQPCAAPGHRFRARVAHRPTLRGKPEADGASPAISPTRQIATGTMPKCASETYTLPRRFFQARRRAGPMAPGVLMGAPKVEMHDAVRQQADR